MALTVHLWTDGPAPLEWVEYQLCQRFHKLPHELEAVPYERMRALLTCIAVENRVQERRAAVEAQKRGTRLH